MLACAKRLSKILEQADSRHRHTLVQIGVSPLLARLYVARGVQSSA